MDRRPWRRARRWRRRGRGVTDDRRRRRATPARRTSLPRRRRPPIRSAPRRDRSTRRAPRRAPRRPTGTARPIASACTSSHATSWRSSRCIIDEPWCRLSITRTVTSPRRVRARAQMSVQPIVRTTASSGIAAASASAVESSSIWSASSHASWNGSCAVSRWAHNHHSGPHSGCRSTTRRQATTSPDGSNRIELIACAVSRTSDAGSAPRARATYRRCSIGCTHPR